MHALTKHKAMVPPEVVTFMRLPGLGPKSAAKIWKELGITTVADLRTAAESEQLRTLSGFGARTEERILHALSQEATLDPVRPLLGAGLARARGRRSAARAFGRRLVWRRSVRRRRRRSVTST